LGAASIYGWNTVAPFVFWETFSETRRAMGQRGSQFKNAKERGEWAEVRFLSRAMEQRFRVAKLWGDSAPYDLMVEQDGIAHRVQVKSTMRRPKPGAYPCHVPAGKRRVHILEEIDFVAAYIIPLDLWYIIPAGVVAMRKGSIWLAPWNRQGKYERYLEAWHLLRRWRTGPYAGKGGGTAPRSRGTRGVRRDKDGAPEGILQSSSSSS
jgi:hypothetical protein